MLAIGDFISFWVFLGHPVYWATYKERLRMPNKRCAMRLLVAESNAAIEKSQSANLTTTLNKVGLMERMSAQQSYRREIF